MSKLIFYRSRRHVLQPLRLQQVSAFRQLSLRRSFSLRKHHQSSGDHPTIQAAIDAATHGDTVLLSDGAYTENIDFKGKAITVKSVNGAAVTIIDGNAANTVVTFSSHETAESVLDGFTIRNGATAPSSFTSGSGIYVGGSSPTIKNNIITGNSGCAGSGIDVYFGSPIIQGNTITNNKQAGCSGGTGGGGILIGGASQPQILTTPSRITQRGAMVEASLCSRTAHLRSPATAFPETLREVLAEASRWRTILTRL